MATANGNHNKSVDRALNLLDLFSSETPSLSVRELAGRLGTTRVTLYPTINALVARGFLERTDDNRFALGMKLVERGGAKLASLDIRRVARPRLHSLAMKLCTNAHLAALHGDEVLYLEREQGRPSVSLREIVGARVSPHCTALGKALLAFSRQDVATEIAQRLKYVQHTQHTISNPRDFLEALESVRLRGYALEAEEFHIGSACIAAPVTRLEDRLVAAISVSFTSADLDVSGEDALARAVMGAAAAISTDLGGTLKCLSTSC